MASDDPMAKFYEAVEFFYSKPWSDGLPIVPPTRELVAAHETQVLVRPTSSRSLSAGSPSTP
jgi:hypothetical protein